MKLVLNTAFLLIFSLLLMHISSAALVEDLYEARVKVQGEMKQSALVKQAFGQVLIKLTGRSDILTAHYFNDLLASADVALQQFRYETDGLDNEAENQAAVGIKGRAEQKLDKWFWARFDNIQVDSLLKLNNLPVWSKNRPATLIWFSQELRGQRLLQGQLDNPEVFTALELQAQSRGIPLLFPFLDLQDQAGVSASDLWGNFTDAISVASQRYQTSSVLTIRLFREPSGSWISQWTHIMLGETYEWQLRGESQNSLMENGIDVLADRLARRYTSVDTGSAGNSLLIRINNVTSFKNYQRVEEYFASLASIKSAQPVQMEYDKFIFRISYQGEQSALIRELKLGDILQPVENSGLIQNSQEPREGAYKPVILDDLEASRPINQEMTVTANSVANQTGQSKTDSQEKNTSGTVSTKATPENSQPLNQNVADKANVEAGLNKGMTTQPPAAEIIRPDLEYWLVN